MADDPKGIRRRGPSDRIAIAVVGLVLAATLVFAAWSYWVAGLTAFVFYLSSELLGWIINFVLVTIFLAPLLMVLMAWPGKGPFWRSVLVTTILGSVPTSIIFADIWIHSFAGIPFTPPTFWNTLFVRPGPLVVYEFLSVALSFWVARLYFPTVRSWRLVAYVAVSAILLLGFPYYAGQSTVFSGVVHFSR